MPSLTVLKISGALFSDEARTKALLSEFSGLPGYKILVHGGKPLVDQLAKKLDIGTDRSDPENYPKEALREAMILAYSGLNKRLTAQLQAEACNAIGVCGADLDLIRSHIRQGNEQDDGFTGEIDEVKAGQIFSLLRQNRVPVFSPLTHNGAGLLLQTSADAIASTVAGSLAAFASTRLLVSMDSPGLLKNPNEPTSLIPHLNAHLYDQLKKGGTFPTQTIQLLDHAFAALHAGVRQVFICAPEMAGRLREEDFVGTEIS